MKLLIVTQTLDSKHSVLGFFVRWVLEFAKQCEQVTVFCLDVGEDVFPKNVTVVKIPRLWKGIKIWPFILALQSFVYRKKYTHVFAHMNPEYVFSGVFTWKIFRKKISFWYAHGTVSLRLKVATFFSNKIFSSTKEGFRYQTSKLCLVGQGIDIALYDGVNLERSLKAPLSLIYIGRISASKRLELLFETVVILKSKYNIEAVCTIIGGPLTKEDKVYKEHLDAYLEEHNLKHAIVWKGPLPLIDATYLLKEADVFVHFGNTGSLDKAVLDAMACGVITMSANEAVKKAFENIHYNFLAVDNPFNAAEKVRDIAFLNTSQIGDIRKTMRKHIEENFSLKYLVERIITKQ